MKRILFLVLVVIILLLAQNNTVKAYSVSTVETNKIGKAFKCDGVGEISDFIVSDKISKTTLKKHQTWTKEFLKIVSPLIKDIKLDVIISRHTVDNIGGFTMTGDKYYIVIAQKQTTKENIFRTVMHEVGHVLQRSKKISLDDYMYEVYGEIYDKKTDGFDWYTSPTEEFAEDFAQYQFIKQKKLKRMDKLTTRYYNNQFNEFIERKLNLKKKGGK